MKVSSLFLLTIQLALLLMSELVLPVFSKNNMKSMNESVSNNVVDENMNEKNINKIHGTMEYRLENGMKVIINEDHSAPIFSQAVFYKVGSRNDEKNFTGAAHFLEHMQFNGTEKFPKGAIAEELERRGGNFNAATGTDYTMYYVTMPSEKDNLRFAMETEVDRMRNSKINPEEAEREKQVVLAELAREENNPISLLYKESWKALYPEHPYGVPIIGWKEDVQRTSAEDLRRHYDLYYEPSNAVLILTGDINSEDALKLAKDIYGIIPVSKEPPSLKFNKRKQTQTPIRVDLDIPSESKAVVFLWDTVSFSHKDYIPLSVLSAILTNGSLSRLEKKLVDTGKANYVSSSARQGLDPFTLSVIATTDQSKNLKEIRSIILSEIQDLKDNGVSVDELERVKAKSETGFLFGLEDPSELANQLGFFEIVFGDWRETYSWADRIKSVSVSDIKRVANEYLTDDNLLIGSLGADKDFKNSSISQPKNTVKNKKTEKIKKAEETKKGIVSEEIILSNGLKVILRENHNGIPIVAIRGVVDAGEVFEKDFGKYGVSGFSAMMSDRGTKNYTRDQLDIALENIGADVDISSSDEYVSIEADSRAGDLEKLLELFSEELISPSFPEEELEKLKAQTIGQLEQSRDDAGYVGKLAFRQKIYPRGHAYYEEKIDDQIKLVKALNKQDLVDFHKSYYLPNRTILSISGDFKRDELLGLLEKYFGSWKNSKELAKKFDVPVVEMKEPSIEEIELAGKSQALVILGHAGRVTRNHPDYYPLLIANEIFGGGSTLTSRLGRDIREKAGLVYSVSSDFAAGRGPGAFSIYMGTAPEKVQTAIDMTKKILNDFLSDGIDDEEFERAKNYRKGAFISHNLISNGNVAEALAFYSMWNMELSTINDYPSKIDAVTKEDVIRVARKYFHPDKLQIVIVKPSKK